MPPADKPAPYEVYAIRYARADRPIAQCFMGHGDPHELAGTLDFNYYIWLVRNADRTIVVDTGFSAEACARRGGGRQMLVSPDSALSQFGVSAVEVETVILTHLHYDHVGNFHLFPKAQFHLQEAEMAYATGRLMAHPVFNAPFEVEEVQAMVGRVYAGRVTFHDGDSEIAPGISVHHVGGHSKGLQCVRVHTRYGWLVLASDAVHLYANMERGDPFPIIHSLEDMFRGFDRVRALADDPRLIVPGHDCEVMRRFPSAGKGLEGLAVRLDVLPND